jgi:hypothetical protein
LEGVGEADQEGVVDVLEDHLLGLCVLYLVLLHDVVLVYRFHREELFCVLFLHQKDGPEGALSQNYLGDEVVDGHLLFQVVPGVESFCGFSDHFLLLFFALEVLLEAGIIVHHKIPLDFLDALLLLLLLGGGVVDQVKFLPIVDGQLSADGHSVGLQYEVYDLIPSISRGVSKSALMHTGSHTLRGRG